MNNGKLYLVATPIGNMGDITRRAVEILNTVDIIACEDTRTSGILLAKLNIKKHLIAHHSYNEKDSTIGIISLLKDGKSVALISDSGMPVISDPGASLVDAVRANNLEVDVIPGASALTTAVAMAALQPPFLFAGFSPATPKKRRRILREYTNLNIPIIFYESPHRIEKFMADIYSVCGNRNIVILRELTKIYQEIIEKPCAEIIEHITNNPLKGEMVVIIRPEKKEKNDEHDSPFEIF